VNSKRVVENLSQIEMFAARLEAILDFDSSAAVEYGRLSASLRHQPIGPLDTLIAAHARSRACALT